MSPGLIPLIMCLVPHDDPLPTWNLAVVAVVVTGLTLITIRRPMGMGRAPKENWTHTCLSYAVPPVIVLFLFPARAEYAGVVLCVLAFGDSAAAIGGQLLGTRGLPWNSDKSWGGLCCFIALSAPIASLVFWGEAHPRVGVPSAVFFATTAAVLAALAESLPMKLDDNIRISIAALVGLLLSSA